MRFGLLLTLCVMLVCNSCRDADHGLKTGKETVKISIERFDQELFLMKTDTIPDAITWLYRKYDDFLDVFSYNIVSIGSPSARDYQAYLTMFLNDRLNREVYAETQRVFPDLQKFEKALNNAFNRYHSAFPENKIPRIVSFVSRFNKSCFTVGDYIGVGLDQYLGTESVYYEKLEIPQYLRINMFPDKIPSDVIYTWASAILPYNDSVDNVLSRIIHEGKLMYFTKSLLPREPDSLIIGYSKNQMKWVEANEEQMWIYLVEKKLLFSRDAMDMRKLAGAAPFTYFFSNASPGRTGVYIGWKIFSEYARRNPDLNFSEMMAETDYEKILRLSKYNP